MPLPTALLSRCCQYCAMGTLPVPTSHMHTRSWVVSLFLMQRELAHACHMRMRQRAVVGQPQ